MVLDGHTAPKICYTTTDILECVDQNYLSVVDLASKESVGTIRSVSAAISKKISSAIIIRLQSLNHSINPPDISSQLANELSNTIEPLVISYLASSKIRVSDLEKLEYRHIAGNISRTGGPSFIKDTVSLTNNGLLYLADGVDFIAKYGLEMAINKASSRNRYTPTNFRRILDIPGIIKRQGISLFALSNHESDEQPQNGGNISIVTAGLRQIEMKNLSWIAEFHDKVICDFYDRISSYHQIESEKKERLADICMGTILGDLRDSSNLDVFEIQFLESFVNFPYLERQLQYFLTEILQWWKIGLQVSKAISANNPSYVICAQPILIRETLLQAACRAYGLPIVGVIHSGANCECNFPSYFTADLYLGWGKIDEVHIRAQNQSRVEFLSGLDDRECKPVSFSYSKNRNKVLVFLTPGQSGTTYIECEPSVTIAGIEKLFQLIRQQPNFDFQLRFHPNYLDSGLINWITKNQPVNSYISTGSIEKMKLSTKYCFAFSLQVLTTGLIDVAAQGIPVRHVLEGVSLPSRNEESNSKITVPLLEDINVLLDNLCSEEFSHSSDFLTQSYLNDVFVGEKPIIHNVAVENLFHSQRLSSVEIETPCDSELEMFMWLRSLLMKSKYRKHWSKPPGISSISRNLLRLRREALITLIQASFLALDRSIFRIRKKLLKLLRR
jgi:hypothetical protein